MSRRRPTGVRGPNSALTEFLRVEGITDAFRQRQSRQTNGRSGRFAATSETPDPETPLSDGNGRSSELQTADASLDASDDDDLEYNDAAFNPEDFKQLGEEDTCVDCGNPFTLTVYSRFVEASKGYICEDCNEILRKRERSVRKSQTAARKRRKKVAKALLDKKTVRLASLQDVCIKVISNHIEDVEILGDIGQNNINKISKILSKNRSLNDSTVTLFLNPSIKALQLWDCSNVTSDSFNKIAAYCSQLESLTLFMCGQLHNDNMTYFVDKLPNLKELALNGPFLISTPKWVEFFEQTSSPLELFEVRNTHRFGNDSLISLLEKHGSQLTLLKLSRLDGLDSEAVYELIPQYLAPSKLEVLEISYPHQLSLIDDDLLIHILATTGDTIKHLNVDGCSKLTDLFLTEGVAKFCPVLESLSIRGLEFITNEGMRDAFIELAEINYGGLLSIDLTKCTGLGNEAVEAVLKHSGKTLVELSLNSIDKLTNSFLLQILTDDADELKVKIQQSIEDGINDGIEEEEAAAAAAAAAAEEVVDLEEDGNNQENGINGDVDGEVDGEVDGNDLDIDQINGGAIQVRQRVVFYPKISLPLLTKLDIGFVRGFDDVVLGKVSDECPKLAIVEVFGNNRCTNKARIRDDLLVIGIQGENL